jgi:hypothetical protein
VRPNALTIPQRNGPFQTKRVPHRQDIIAHAQTPRPPYHQALQVLCVDAQRGDIRLFIYPADLGTQVAPIGQVNRDTLGVFQHMRICQHQSRLGVHDHTRAAGLDEAFQRHLVRQKVEELPEERIGKDRALQTLLR